MYLIAKEIISLNANNHKKHFNSIYVENEIMHLLEKWTLFLEYKLKKWKALFNWKHDTKAVRNVQ